uniref:C2H2-type domain-containing protein n=1 Tax=Emiliania huxleyi TaxID=2903 RepID=A0A7S3U306_EMIHU
MTPIAMTPAKWRQPTRDAPPVPTCSQCGRTFTSERGLRAHVRSVHVLQLYGKDGGAAKTCEHCARVFSNEDALRQHVRARHSSDAAAVASPTAADVLRPHWAGRGGALATDATGDYQCDICGLCFGRANEEEHLRCLRPALVKEVRLLVCGQCGRSFGDSRALAQHRLACNAASATT